MTMPALLWLFPVVVTLHNLEEALWLPKWSLHAGRWYKPVAPKVFWFAAAVVTILAWGLVWIAVLTGRQTIWAYLVFVYVVAVLVNVLIPHLVFTVAMRRYMPGTATGLLLNVPVAALLISLMLKQNYVSGWRAVACCLAVPAVLFASIRLLLRAGEALTRMRRIL